MATGYSPFLAYIYDLKIQVQKDFALLKKALESEAYRELTLKVNLNANQISISIPIPYTYTLVMLPIFF
jgi:hypothetical protein